VIYGRCFTPDEYRGNCIKFANCKPLFDLMQKKPPNPQDRLYISLSQCGFRDGQPLVCCRDAPSVQPSQPTPVPVGPPAASSNAFLPKPGVCGNDDSNRIYGGNRVSSNRVNYNF
jgi:Regulatory CLIP domain of proteinases